MDNWRFGILQSCWQHYRRYILRDSNYQVKQVTQGIVNNSSFLDSHEKHESMYWSVFGQLASQQIVRMWRKLSHRNFLRLYKCKKYQTLTSGSSTPFALPVHTTFSDLEYISRSQVSNSFDWKFYVLIRLSLNFLQLLVMSSRSWIYQYFLFLHMCKEENGHISLFEQNFNVPFFSDTIKARSFKLCLIITLLGVYIFIVLFKVAGVSEI